MKKFISTTLPYVNSQPHIGHLFEFVLADYQARNLRFHHDVFFNVGVDEHGLKVQKEAEKQVLDPQYYCDQIADNWKEFCDLFEISYDNFYRTSSTLHKDKTHLFFKQLNKDKNVYQKEYEGYYCVGCESFIPENQLVNYNCPIHKQPVVKESETNLFFNLSKFRNVITPRFEPRERLQSEYDAVSQQDEISITRRNVKWGIPFDKDQTFYVWFEALLNYPFAAGWDGYGNDEFFLFNWCDARIFCGGDNLRFQAYILPCILAAGDIPGIPRVFVHSTIVDEKGGKISKSLGNGIDIYDLVNKYGVSPIRFYLLAGFDPRLGTGKFSEENLRYVWNNLVVNKFGNLLSRALHLIDTREVDVRGSAVRETTILDKIDRYEYKEAFAEITSILDEANQLINDKKPYDVNSTDYKEVLRSVYSSIKAVSPFFCTAIPEYADHIQEALNYPRKAVLFKVLK